jgi:hypothetical protein
MGQSWQAKHDWQQSGVRGSIPSATEGSIPMRAGGFTRGNSSVNSMKAPVLAGIQESRQAIAFIAACRAVPLATTHNPTHFFYRVG